MKMTATVYCKSDSFVLVLKNYGDIYYAHAWENADEIDACQVADFYMHFLDTGDLPNYAYSYCDDYDDSKAIEIADRFKHYGIAFSDQLDEDCTDSLGLICSLSENEQQIAVPFMKRCMEYARNMQES